MEENLAEDGFLSEESVRAACGSLHTVGRSLQYYDTLPSTNTHLRQLALRGAEDGTAVLAGAQSAGRGRMGREFQSAAGKGLYLSVLLRLAPAAEKLLPLTGFCAVAVQRAILRVCALRTQIKWTNDLVWEGKKLCGILTEPCFSGDTPLFAVVGVGVNVSQRPGDFSGDVRDVAVSLAEAVGHPVSRAALCAAILEELDALYAALLAGNTAEYLADYRRTCLTLGREVRLLWKDTAAQATALDVDEQLGLIVRYADGRTETVRTGEVSVRGLYGYTE